MNVLRLLTAVRVPSLTVCGSDHSVCDKQNVPCLSLFDSHHIRTSDEECRAAPQQWTICSACFVSTESHLEDDARLFRHLEALIKTIKWL